MTADYSYNAKEKLKSRKLIEELFTKGRSFSVFPVKVFYMPLTEMPDHPIKAGVGVSAKNFRKAVDRNRIKRLLRECYRLNKQSICKTAAEKPLAVFFLYIGKEIPEFSFLNEKMRAALDKLDKVLA